MSRGGAEQATKPAEKLTADELLELLAGDRVVVANRVVPDRRRFYLAPAEGTFAVGRDEVKATAVQQLVDRKAIRGRIVGLFRDGERMCFTITDAGRAAVAERTGKPVAAEAAPSAPVPAASTGPVVVRAESSRGQAVLYTTGGPARDGGLARVRRTPRGPWACMACNSTVCAHVGAAAAHFAAHGCAMPAEVAHA